MAEEEEWVGYTGGAVQEWHRTASRIRVASGVTVIPQEAFMDCENLRALDLSNVTTISDHSFHLCSSLEHIIWPSSMVEIGVCTFGACVALTAIDLSNATKIGWGAFFECTALERVSIPSSVVEIEQSAFEDCTNLAEVELGEGIQRIGKMAFYQCRALVRINIPASVTAIGDEAFEGCSNLEEVQLSEGLQHIGRSAFWSCWSLPRISIPSTVLKVEGFINCSNLVEVELNEGVQVIASAFGSCPSLECITIPSSVTLIGRGTFDNCTSLSEVTLREGVLDICSGAFHRCTSLEHINIPPVAMVIDIESRSCQLMRASMPKPENRTLIASKWMQYRSPSQLEQAKAKVNEILGRQRQPEGQKVASIRDWFTYFNLLDVTTMLELAIWRCNNDNGQDAEARQRNRRNCGNDMNIIIPGVLDYLEE